MTLRTLFWILLPVAAVAVAGWWARDVPTLQGWLPVWLRQVPDLSAGGVAPGGAAASARKCRGATHVLYTDGPCPAGLREEAVTGGSVTVLPAVRPLAAATAAAPAGSSQTPLRRLAGPDDSAAQRERVLEQALHR